MLWFRGLTFADNRGLQLHSQAVRQFVHFVFAVDLDGLLGRIADYVAVVAPSEVLLELGFYGGVERAVKKIIQLG